MIEKLKSWLGRIVEGIKGKSVDKAETKQGMDVASERDELAPTKRYEVVSGQKQAPQSQAQLRFEERLIPLQPGFLVGRGSSCHLRLTDLKVSRIHARFNLTEAGWVIQDNASRNGTFVNGRRIQQARLESGDTIQIGQTRLIYEER